jgi:hypothetical protein
MDYALEQPAQRGIKAKTDEGLLPFFIVLHSHGHSLFTTPGLSAIKRRGGMGLVVALSAAMFKQYALKCKIFQPAPPRNYFHRQNI